ncbi:xylosidase/arabinosidase [Puniceicoccales bacterium CK1056]|uniref:Xylosidase/arabinosidase n=1 Tax=Oceanipulchritudo coccoides TaxID=2706888 RepID=A0A6B2LY80_9BACT|nr:glycoside hydrolase family 71/99-like protein [Oceanipulchritudo coccoides]NDV61581.1 xylosidase/arabinosidase [Oceanipulchritudo coccoides]
MNSYKFRLIVLAVTFLTLSSGAACKSQVDLLPAADGLEGKVFAGYQGWYRTPTDGSGLGWEHYETYDEQFKPGHVGIDYWPDESELTPSEKYATDFRHADGRVAHVFSTQHPATIDRHFKWMRQYNIDGIFLQRFALDVVGFHHQAELLLPSNNRKLEFIQQSANHHSRAYSIMYDLSGMPHGEMDRVKQDWKDLQKQFRLSEDRAYLHMEGKPLVAIWGVGFVGRDYTLEEVADLIDFLKNDPEFGGCSILLGIPTFWRTLEKDATTDSKLHEVIASADVILPWSVGRFGGSETALKRTDEIVRPDMDWCEAQGVKYMPLAFPGFSWANRYVHKNAAFDSIPREGGKFLWAQAVAAKRSGADTLYIAMFDEMDEGTQIFKVSNDVPVGESRFLDYSPHAPDYYLRLTGAIRRMLRGTIPATDGLPENF